MASAPGPGAGRRGCGRAGPLRARTRRPRDGGTAQPQNRERSEPGPTGRERSGRRWPHRPGPT